MIGKRCAARLLFSLLLALVGGALLLLERAAPATTVVIPAEAIRHRGGHSYIAPLAEHLEAAIPLWPLRVSPVDRPQAPTASPHRLLEDGVPLGPAHTQHDAIAASGGGTFSVWGEAIYFSSSDGSDPRTGARRYQIELHSELPRLARVLGWSLLAVGSTVLLAAAGAAVGRGFTAIATRPRRRWRDGVAGAMLGAACCAAAAAIALFAGRPGSAVLLIHPATIVPSEGLAFAVSLEPLREEAQRRLGVLRRPGPSDAPGAERRSRLVLRGDDAALPHPHAQFAEIACAGAGRYMVWGDLLAFSTPDGSDPRAEEGRYAIEFDARAARWVPLLCGILLLTGALLCAVALPARLWRRILPLLTAGVPAALLLAVLRWPALAPVAGWIPPGLIFMALLLWAGRALGSVAKFRIGRRGAAVQESVDTLAPEKAPSAIASHPLRGLSLAGVRLRRVIAALLHRLEGPLGAWSAALLVGLSLLFVWSSAGGALERPLWTLDSSRGFGAFEGRGQAADALGYLANSQWLLWTGEAQPFGARRPLYTTWLAGVSSITGLDLQALVAAQAVLLAMALWLAMRAIGQQIGSAVALVTGAITLGFAQQFMGVTMTETLGLPLGLLAAALLLPAVRRGAPVLLASGSFVLALALIVRPGAILVAALLPLALAWVARRHHRRSALAAAGWSAAGLVAAMAVNAGFESRMGRGDAASNSNAGYVLYGLSVGRDWTAGEEWLAQNAPQLGEREQAARLIAAALENIQRDPRPFAGSLVASLGSFLTLGASQLSAHFADRGVLASDGPWWRRSDLLVWGLLGPLALLWRMRGHPATGPLLLAALVGVLLTAPLIWRDGGWRALASTLALQAVIAGFFLAPAKAPTLRRGADRGPALALGAIMALLGICALGAWIVPGRLEERPRPLVDAAEHALPLFTAPRRLCCLRIEPAPQFRWLGPASLTLEQTREALRDWDSVPALQCLLERVDPTQPHLIAQAFGVNRGWGLVGATILVPPALLERVEAEDGELAVLEVEWCASTLYFGEVGVLREITP